MKKSSSFYLSFMGMIIGMWLLAAFLVADDVRVKDYSQMRWEEILQYVPGETVAKSSQGKVWTYRNDVSAPKPEDEATVVRFLAERDFAFYKGKIAKEELVDAKRKEKRKICHVVMGIFFGVSVIMSLIVWAEGKSRQKVIIVDAHGD